MKFVHRHFSRQVQRPDHAALVSKRYNRVIDSDCGAPDGRIFDEVGPQRRPLQRIQGVEEGLCYRRIAANVTAGVNRAACARWGCRGKCTVHSHAGPEASLDDGRRSYDAADRLERPLLLARGSVEGVHLHEEVCARV